MCGKDDLNIDKCIIVTRDRRPGHLEINYSYTHTSYGLALVKAPRGTYWWYISSGLLNCVVYETEAYSWSIGVDQPWTHDGADVAVKVVDGSHTYLLCQGEDVFQRPIGVNQDLKQGYGVLCVCTYVCE